MARQYPSAFQPLLSETEATQTTNFGIDIPTMTVDGLVGRDWMAMICHPVSFQGD
ncbi:hypothetical protein IFT84_10990 [Rhizobium sp. CFBP 8762]|uniref:hypothetical protein n=1 Tax=Rhizobium sp. CFBP 8762 TaxID=2775279 RepID=UPI00177B1856|nr:hypothetical protein [Rhizobium sp. CFBP 8762]MBD8555050.1 hypothetical protein [Rhizobium sp. CFBP 8762]